MAQAPDYDWAVLSYIIAVNWSVLGTWDDYRNDVLWVLEIDRSRLTRYKRTDLLVDGTAGESWNPHAQSACSDSKTALGKMFVCPFCDLQA